MKIYFTYFLFFVYASFPYYTLDVHVRSCKSSSKTFLMFNFGRIF